MATLTEEDRLRYDRQIIFPGWGEEGQQKLKEAEVFVAGAGGLGSPVSIYLAVAGVGKIRICDFGEPELSNLNRQILHTDTDIGKNKAVSARETLESINPAVDIIDISEKIEKENVSELVGGSSIILDCMDNYTTRHILNAYACESGLPFIHAAVHGMSGQLSFFSPPETPCLHCVVPIAPPPEVFPIVGATAAVIGSLEALEALKYLVGKGTNLKNRLLIWDGELVEFHTVEIKKDPQCPVCGKM
jgi:adenylyltransferase/sulfurtransferase